MSPDTVKGQGSAVSIEPYTPADIDALMEIENRSFTAPWSRASYEELWPLESVTIWVARRGDELVGYMLLQHIGDEMELHTLGVKPEVRRQGIARQLLDHMIAEAGRLRVQHVFLQVRPSNTAARALYDVLGFKVIGVRRGYYRDDNEDALVLRLDISETGEKSQSGEKGEIHMEKT